MKPIKLTEEHKTRLLEMCRNLFPEFKDWKFSKTRVQGGNDYSWFELEEYITANEPAEPYEFTMHWLEFCITYLSSEICRKSNASLDKFMQNVIGVIWFNKLTGNRHLIDYLYEKFNQLKLN